MIRRGYLVQQSSEKKKKWGVEENEKSMEVDGHGYLQVFN